MNTVILPLFFLTRVLSTLAIPLALGRPIKSVSSVKLRRVGIDGEVADLGMEFLSSSSENVMLVFGTHVADFNTIEYLQRIRYVPGEGRWEIHNSGEREVAAV